MGTKSNFWNWVGAGALLLFLFLGYRVVAWLQKDDAIYWVHVRSRAISLGDLEWKMKENDAVVTNHWDNYRVVEITGDHFQERVLLEENAFMEWKIKYGGK